MSIRIFPKEPLEVKREKPTTLESIPPLLFANLKSLYRRRAERLRQLALNNSLGDYLNFAAQLAEAQHHALHDYPLTLDLSEVLEQGATSGKPPLDVSVYTRSEHWHLLLTSLIAELLSQVPEHILAVLDNLEKASVHEWDLMADILLNGEFSRVGSEKAPFIWAALSLYWTQMASLLPGKAPRAEYGENHQFCPVCGSIPVASIVLIGTINGLRYLHCNLCESEWHLVRVKCSNCEQAAVKAESCGDCGTYLKILYQEKDPQVEAVADDLASLVLDARMEEEGFSRTSINPFLFPAE
ncbi:formate dehydrogenase accessory protein FdhE [Serratia symbiotica]|uniref:formate dehydrogenase accessory protein FdhE n=1 Tax=Serratia symbiotica TaxID=138074 RepID=UPI001D898F1B|nr:formate dehydrogenase accessory protein FdhE [Serratia symbiotica]NIG87809.1 formate dehydrogenase accessory protein FdhE [Serratia symbiotica]USS95792.1 formate dehydrogenase accessory protein FdhE [Serratia symbiotica]